MQAGVPVRSLTLKLGSATRRLEPASSSTAHWQERDTLALMGKPLLLVDLDGVISLYGFEPNRPPAGKFEWVDGIAHFLSLRAGEHLRRLSSVYELAWCSGWEEKANEYLPVALDLPTPFPYVRFEPVARLVEAHWKLAGIDMFAGAERPLAWVDDAHDERCEAWARGRPGPTLLLATEPSVGLTERDVERLIGWAQDL
jgi:hypothetical protein